MLSIPSVVKIYLHAAPVNLHFSFDRLAGIVSEEMGQDPLSGHLFVFRNRRGDRVKLLFWDDDGYAFFYKRLQKGVFQFPVVAPETRAVRVSVTDLSLLLWGIEPASVRRQKRFNLAEHRAAHAVTR
jgi:transposase